MKSYKIWAKLLLKSDSFEFFSTQRASKWPPFELVLTLSKHFLHSQCVILNSVIFIRNIVIYSLKIILLEINISALKFTIKMVENTEKIALEDGDVHNLNENKVNDDNEESNKNDITLPGRIVPAPGVSVQFKKPLLVGPRKGAQKFTKIKPHEFEKEEGNKSTAEVMQEKSETTQPSKKSEKSPAEILAENNIPVPYKEPKWSGLPSCSYSFEVLKSGTIVEKFDLNKKPFFVFGRLGNCDIVMAHPTVSRFHAVMQYRTEGEGDNGPGFYIYDLGSTHGTFLNRNKLKPNVYVRVQVGHMIKLGMSSRNFILQGPPEDEEPESELTVTELKELRQKEKLEAEAAEKQRIILQELEEERLRKKEEEEGIDWGMGEDADEETDLSENPFAATQNEDLYVNDPKKTLRGWFEREGYELEYNCEEKGFGQFICRIELPIDNAKGTPTIAEAIVRGKKKEAVVQCALEACRILDQHGLLRQSNHESKKRKAKNWEENDYYDSDEDTYLDRTGTVEKKRQLRMEQAGIKTGEVHTYQSLINRHEEILREIEKLEQQIRDCGKTNEEKVKEDDNVDELDAYMSSLTKGDKKSKVNIHKLKQQLGTLRQEEVNVRKLANVAKPAELPQLKPSPSELPKVDKKHKLPIFGKRKTTKKPLQVCHILEEEKKQLEEGSHSAEEEIDSE